MSETKRVLLIDPLDGAARMPELAEALRAAGAEVREISLGGDFGAVLDALEQDYLPVVLKVPARP
jgi:hypothetical protein